MEHAKLSGVLSRILSHSEDKLPKINTGAIEEPKFLTDLSADSYHADKTRMSSTGLKTMLRSPRHFLTAWSGLTEEEGEKDHFRIGRAAHLMLLEPAKFREVYVIEPVHQGLTKDGKPTTSLNAESVKIAKELWRAKQRPDAIIVSEKELDNLVGMIEAVLEHPVAAGMLQNGKPECSLNWTDEETGIMCKARPDYVVDDKNGQLHLIDFKTARDIRSGIFSSDAYRMSYGVQLAFYHDGLVRVLGRQPSTITIIAVEKEAPFESAVYPLADRWFEHGQERYKHAMRLYKKCRDTGKWPRFQQNAQLLEMPNAANFDSLPEFSFE
jgi:hypothetical protein